MTREEAIQVLKMVEAYGLADEAKRMAIEALEREDTDEWCDDCKEYDTEKKCCPRFNKVIREALKREPSEDGTLEVKVEDATKVGRVLISDDKHRGGLYYPDEDEPKGDDLISRAEAIRNVASYIWHLPNDVYPQFNGYNVIENIVMDALSAVPSADRLPSADRPRGHWKDGIWCSVCGMPIVTDVWGMSVDESEVHYCIECGARMEGGEDK